MEYYVNEKRQKSWNVRRSLPKKIKSFDEDDEISWLCPGKKDYVHVKDGTGKKIGVPLKRMVGLPLA